MKLNKKLTRVIATGILALSITYPTYGDFIKLYEDTDITQLSKGTQQKTITRFYDHGWLKINVLEVNLKSRGTEIKLIRPNPTLKDRLPLTIQSEFQEDNIIGGINGDFFDTNTSESIGPMISDSTMLSSAKNDPRFSVFTLTENNTPSIDYFLTDSMEVYNSTKDTRVKLDYFNKAYKDNALSYIDQNWSSQTIGYEDKDILEIITIHDKIIDVRFNQEQTDIPVDGYALIATGSRATELKDTFKKGNRLKIETNIPNEDAIKLAMGGGAKIISDGMVNTPFSLAISGRHPRTALGISKDNKRLFLVTVDGRTSSYPGLSQQELANIMLELGAYNAVNLDGGGSTEMIVKGPSDYGYNIVNTPSSGYERSLANGLGVVNNSFNTTFKDISVEIEDTNVFVGTSRKLNISAFDKNYNPFKINLKSVDFNVEGVDGYFKEGIFYPMTPGIANITVEYRGVKKELQLNVLDKPVELIMSPKKVSFEKLKNTNFDIKLVDENGYSAKVDKGFVNWIFSGTEVKDLDKLKELDRMSSSSILISATYDDLTAYSQIANYYKGTITEDFEYERGTFSSYPATVTGSYSLSKNSYGGSTSGQLKFDFSNVQSNKAAYFIFNDGGKKLDIATERVGLWVYGNEGKNHWLRAKVLDANGKSYNLTLARNIDWLGWREVSTDIPSSIPKPITIERIYVVEPDLTLADSGRVLFDTFTEYRIDPVDDIVPEKNIKPKNISYTQADDNLGFSFGVSGKRDVESIDTVNLRNHIIDSGAINIFFDQEDLDGLLRNGLNIYTPTPYRSYTYKNATFIELKNNSRGFRNVDYTQWQWLLKNKDNINTKNVFITLPSKLRFTDKLEEELFYKVLDDIKKQGKEVCIISGGSNNTDSIDIKNGIYIVNLKDLNSDYLNIQSSDTGINFIK